MYSIHTVHDLWEQRNGLINLVKLGEHAFFIGYKAIFNAIFALFSYYNTSNFHNELLNLSYIFHEHFVLCFVYFLLLLYLILFLFMSF